MYLRHYGLRPKGQDSLKKSLFSVVLEFPHPLGPILRLHAARPGPGPSHIEILVPLQRPELFKSHPAYGPVQKKAVDAAIVPVDTEVCHVTPERCHKTGAVETVLILRRLVLGARPRRREDTVKKERNVVSD